MDACTVPTPRPLRSRIGAALAIAAVACLASAAFASARVATLPNPCTILASAHPQDLKGTGSVTVGRGTLKTYGSGKYEQVTCNETVGPLTVYLSYYMAVGGSGGVRVVSQTHPSGFGGTATLTVGTGVVNNSPVDYLVFKKGALYADLGANGAEPSQLAALGREIYKLTP
jgi:hypothetical protein